MGVRLNLAACGGLGARLGGEKIGMGDRIKTSQSQWEDLIQTSPGRIVEFWF